MANYQAFGRSNRFRVRDEKAFRASFEGIGDDLSVERMSDGRMALFCSEGWPTSYEDVDDDSEFDIYDTIADHLADGEVAVLMLAVREGASYVGGDAVAINSDGVVARVSLGEIYPRAAAALSVPEDSIGLAQY